MVKYCTHVCISGCTIYTSTSKTKLTFFKTFFFTPSLFRNRKIKLSSKILQNLPYFWNKKSFFRFHFELINVVFVDQEVCTVFLNCTFLRILCHCDIQLRIRYKKIQEGRVERKYNNPHLNFFALTFNFFEDDINHFNNDSKLFLKQ
jgi:hypothetical protein